MDNKYRSNLKMNIIYQMIYELLALALPLITSPYISRRLGAEGLGVYSYTYSIASYFGLFSMLGVKNHGNREIAKCKGQDREINSTFSNIYAVQVCTSLIALFSYIVFAALQTENRLYYFIQILYLLSCAMDISWFYFGIEQFKITVTWNSIIKLLNFITVFLFVQDKNDLWKYSLIMALSMLLSQLALWKNFHKYANCVTPNFLIIKQHFKSMTVLFVPVLAVSLYNIMDKIMVGALSTKTELGYYENSEKIINCVKTVLTSFGTVMMPRMSRLVAEKDEIRSQKYMRISFELIMLLAVAFSFGIASVAPVFAPIYWGKEFSPCAILMSALSVSLPFSAIANIIRTQYIIPHNYDKQYIIAVIAGGLINLFINGMLIHKYGAFGAVVGTIMAETVVCCVQCAFARHDINIREYFSLFLLYCAMGIIMFVSVAIADKFLMQSIMGLIGRIMVGIIVYVILTLIYLYLSNNAIIKILKLKR